MTLKEREEIFEIVNEIKANSTAYQLQYGPEESQEGTNSLSLCPSKEFVDNLFKEVAAELGIKL